MHLLLRVIIAVLVLPAAALGQGMARDDRGNSSPAASEPWIRPLLGSPAAGWPPRDPPPSFAIPPLMGRSTTGVPLPSIGLPLAPIGLQPRRGIDRHMLPRHHRRRGFAPGVIVVVPHVFGVPVAVAGVPVAVAQAPPPPVEQLPAMGTLVLDVQPGTAQVFVDGYYAGTPDDLNALHGGLVLEPGPHRIELTARGYEPVSFDVKIAAYQSIAYRRAMERVAGARDPEPAPASPVLSAPTTFYLIPGCYLGNVPPEDAGLPATCDTSRVLTFEQ